MSENPKCPECQSTYAYEDRGFYNCPECGHVWSATAGGEAGGAGDETGPVVRDANGTELKDGDTVTLIKDLKLKNSSDVVKVGTKVKNIRLVEGDHNIDCKVPGIGPMGLKSEFVKKVVE
ncbi:MAG: alkylphosphonate utilization protein [Alphaproteobacteria bacterium]|nr:alkylphosphonate utilization protein [Alphaproteobacteria bacterium]